MADIRRTPLQIPAAWTAAEMAKNTDWVHRVSSAEIAELDAAISAVKARSLGIPDIRREDFALPTLAPKIARMQKELEEGSGAMLIRGLPVARWGQEDSLLAYWGIGVHLGEITGQNGKGHRLGFVRATGRDWDKDHTVRGYQTTSWLPFHCDKGDIVGLLCLHGAKSGGTSCFASSIAIHNVLLGRRPDLVEALYSDLYVDLRGEEPPGMKPYYLQPMYGYYKGRLYGRMGRKYVESGQRFPEVPRLTERQAEAMEVVEALAASDEFRLDMEFEQGDIQWLNNHTVMHSRNEYEDWPEPERRRHLVRMLVFSSAYRDVPDYVQHINDVTRWWRDHPKEAVAV